MTNIMDAEYQVNDIYAAIQGEGCNTGIPMVILRLQGCDVGCPWCDTKETWVVDPQNERGSIQEALGANLLYTNAMASDLAYYARVTYPSLHWVLLTGGEPAIQNLRALVYHLHLHHFKVALETSGTELGHKLAQLDWVCVSPKFNMPNHKPVLPDAMKMADEIKLVVGKRSDVGVLDDWLSANGGVLRPSVTFCLQPVSVSPKATTLCIQIVQERGWRLSIQTHRLLNLR